MDCMRRLGELLKQAHYVILIKLKAATMSRPCGDAELDWRFDTWLKQYRKELIRLVRAYHYRANINGELGNIDENEYDEGWRFPVPQEEIRLQRRELNERFDRGDETPEYDFFLDRPNMVEEVVEVVHGTADSDESTEIEVEATDDDDQDMAGAGDGPNMAEEVMEVVDLTADASTESEVEATDDNDPDDNDQDMAEEVVEVVDLTADTSTESEVEFTDDNDENMIDDEDTAADGMESRDNNDQEMTDEAESEGENDDEGRETSEPSGCGDNNAREDAIITAIGQVSDADIAAARILIDFYHNPRQGPAVLTPTDADNRTPDIPESATTSARNQPSSNSEGSSSISGTRGLGLLDSICRFERERRSRSHQP